MAKLGDIWGSPGRDCGTCGGDGVVLGGSRANPQEKPCPDCNSDKQQGAWV